MACGVWDAKCALAWEGLRACDGWAVCVVCVDVHTIVCWLGCDVDREAR